MACSEVLRVGHANALPVGAMPLMRIEGAFVEPIPVAPDGSACDQHSAAGTHAGESAAPLLGEDNGGAVADGAFRRCSTAPGPGSGRSLSRCVRGAAWFVALDRMWPWCVVVPTPREVAAKPTSAAAGPTRAETTSAIMPTCDFVDMLALPRAQGRLVESFDLILARRKEPNLPARVPGNLIDPRALTGMPKKHVDTPRTRAEKMFRTREEQKADAPVAMQEYRAAQQAALERMRQLRELRLAHEAKLAESR